MNEACKKLSSRDRWLVYLTIAGLPGLAISVIFGFAWSLVFEVIVWIPQQRLFDSLELAKTLPFQDVR